MAASANFFMTVSPSSISSRMLLIGFYMRYGPGRLQRYFLTASAARHLLERLGVTRPGDGDLPGSLLDGRKVGRRELEVGGGRVLLEPLALAGARNRHDPRLARQQPAEG